jgi:hypothetical protein
MNPFLTSALGAGEWSGPCPGRFTSRQAKDIGGTIGEETGRISQSIKALWERNVFEV